MLVALGVALIVAGIIASAVMAIGAAAATMAAGCEPALANGLAWKCVRYMSITIGLSFGLGFALGGLF